MRVPPYAALGQDRERQLGDGLAGVRLEHRPARGRKQGRQVVGEAVGE